MPVIELKTIINAPIERCFLLATSIDLHMATASETNEVAVAGVTTGCIKLNETVTWRARHLGFTQHLTSKITEYAYPTLFVDEMQKGIFKKLHHTHFFTQENNTTIMQDIFVFEAPMGFLGRLAEIIFLTRYLKRFLIQRNAVVKEAAETDKWQKYL
jgi:ligand-binding SRPBCC domain-containing protein